MRIKEPLYDEWLEKSGGYYGWARPPKTMRRCGQTEGRIRVRLVGSTTAVFLRIVEELQARRQQRIDPVTEAGDEVSKSGLLLRRVEALK